MPRILRNEEIERIAGSRLDEYEKRNNKISNPPVPIDRIIEDCNLSVLYDIIEERSGESILAALNVEKRLIVINESHMGLFQEKPGLERYTKAHELGHWDIYIDKSDKDRQLFVDFYSNLQKVQKVTYRNSKVGKVSVLLSAWTDENVYEAYKVWTRGRDHPNVASAVNRYASALLMPNHLIMHHVSTRNLTNWTTLYEVAKMFGVTISAMCARLERLSLIYVKDKKIYRTKDEVEGQEMLNF